MLSDSGDEDMERTLRFVETVERVEDRDDAGEDAVGVDGELIW